MARTEQPIPTPRRQRVEDFKQRRLPLIVWSAAALLCVWMLGNRASRFESIGLAQTLVYEISADTAGRLDTVVVQVYDEVRSGDVLAKLEDKQLGARLETANAVVRKLAADLDAARVELLTTRSQDRADWTVDLRRFQIDEEERRLEALELRVTIEAEEIELERLDLELLRAGPLLETGLIGQQEYDQTRLLRDETRKRVEENKILLAQTRDEYESTRGRRIAFEKGLPTAPDQEPLLRPLRAAIDVETRRVHELELERESLVLRSPVDGQVSSVLCRRGQSVVPGEPIVTVAEHAVREIVVYLDEQGERRVTRNAPVLVASRSRPDKVAESFVLRIGPTVELMPQRLWRDPATPDYGRAVVIAAIPGLDLAPGELLNVSFPSDR